MVDSTCCGESWYYFLWMIFQYFNSSFLNSFDCAKFDKSGFYSQNNSWFCCGEFFRKEKINIVKDRLENSVRFGIVDI